LAWLTFKENVNLRVALGMVAIVAGALVLSWPSAAQFGTLLPTLAILGACLAWSLDNNLTRKVSLTDATWVAMVKGLTAGSVNLGIARLLGASLPRTHMLAGAAALGFCAYGISLTLFVIALRHLGTARTGAYFSVAPFIGAALAIVLLGEAITLGILVAGALMSAGVWLHLSERHDHWHVHEALEHEHEHEHDAHHDHHRPGEVVPIRHTHRHHHLPLAHSHEHFPDEHHRHSH
jgi:drug/metabolite transporter (DMT)-like permease